MFLNTRTYLSVFLNCQANIWHGFSQATWYSTACRAWKPAVARTVPCRQFGCGTRMGFSGTGMGCSVSADLYSRNFVQTYYAATDTTLWLFRHSNKDRVLQTAKLLHSSPPFQKQEDRATVKGVGVLQSLPESRQVSSWGVRALLWEARDFLYVWGSDLRYFIENKCLNASYCRAEQVWVQQQRSHNLMGKKNTAVHPAECVNMD